MTKAFWETIRKMALIMLIPPVIVFTVILRIWIEKEINKEAS